MWGGTPDRNMVSNAKGLPTDWDIKTKKNIRWTATLGSQSYGNPVVAEGVVLVGTNNEAPRDPKQGGDRGVLMAFDEKTGEFLWQQTHEKLPAGRANDWPFQGVASSPLVENGRVYYVSNRGVLICLDIKGFANGNDGPVTNEKFNGPKDADVIWEFDMMEQVGSYPHNMSNSSPVIWGDQIYVSTSNGQDESHVHIPSPKAPAIISVNKKTASWCGRTTRWRTASCTASGRRRPSARSATWTWWSADRATAGCAATRPRAARSCGSSTPTPRIPSGRARATKSSRPRHLPEPRLHRQRPGSGAR
jgi:outer membrane protein assembly factor BamB